MARTVEPAEGGGYDYTDDETGEVEHFDTLLAAGQYLNERTA